MAKSKKIPRPESVSGGYSAIPWVVMDSTSFKGASDKAKSLLLALARQHSGANNGHLHLVNSWLSKQGWTSKSNNKKARDELIERGLIIQTRQGGLNMGNDKFALTWHDISNYVGLEISPNKYQRGKYLLCNMPPTERRKPPSVKSKKINPSSPIIGSVQSRLSG